ncbi:DNA polymerase III subunit delta' [Marinobacter confluentis]|uniref:DNA-directed DNA polymerase n=1 Tax=Marinobacter confluentis TaxID=1697557 RepID=A0A4Z1BFR3_9GAMM|nr:DNA polymerase III subunit delta' [Marinobacter confluentis]TGN41574.1 DNA polymerase III subunit delta' [Marinobacter confluentis]
MSWLHDPWQRLRQSFAENRLPHALLVIGEQGVGKRFFADQLAALLVCDQPDLAKGERCGRCKQCELTSAQTHPDIRRYAPEKSRMIRIDQIRALSAFAVASPQVARRKVALIDRADQLNINSANALLKTLEEPVSDLVLILLQETGRPILPTIRSRCQTQAIATPSAGQASAWLQAQLEQMSLESPPTAQQCDQALALAANAPRLALEYLTGDFMTQRQDALEQFRQFMKGQVSVGEAARPFKALGLEASLWLFEGWAADLARLCAGGAARDGEAAEMLGFLARNNPAWRAHELLEMIHESRSAGVYNVSPELEAGRLLIAWQRLMPVKRAVTKQVSAR